MADDTGIVKMTRGRPKGSKNKPKVGRPKGRKSEYTMTPAALLQRRNISGSLPARTDEEKEYNNKLIAHIMQIHAIAENADRHDLNSLKSCFVNYLKLCQQDGILLHMHQWGLTRKRLISFQRRMIRKYGSLQVL